MRDPFRWSISLGRWSAATVKLHIFFPVFAVATYFLCWQSVGHDSLFGWTSVALIVLLLSVLAHEWTHWWTARRYGMAPTTLIVGPLGGVTPWPTVRDARGELTCALAGPAANLAIFLVGAATMRVVAPQTAWFDLVNPLQPVWTAPRAAPAQQVLQLTLWINWLLFLSNLLPAFPFDGGRILRGLVGLVQPRWSEKRVADVVFWIAVAFSAIIMAVALTLWKYEEGAVLPVSFAVLLLAVVLLVSACRDAEVVRGAPRSRACEPRREDWLDGADAATTPSTVASEDEEELVEEQNEYETRLSDSPLWPDNAVASPAELTAEQEEAEEEQTLDEVLSRLHDRGLECLTHEERVWLERVSQRYRDRLGRGG